MTALTKLRRCTIVGFRDAKFFFFSFKQKVTSLKIELKQYCKFPVSVIDTGYAG